MNDQQTNPSVARPEISVILPVYNAAATLRQAVRSILDQSLTQIEILAVYDISKDGSENILFDIAAGDKRVRPILNTGRKLLAAALNVGIQAANAEFIARMDADDIAFPGRLERQLSFLQNNPAVAICGTAAILIDEDGRNIGHFDPPLGHENLVTCAEYAPPMFHPTWMGRAAVLKAIGGYREIPNCEDYDLLLRALSAGYELDNCPFDGIQYRVRSSHRANIVNHKAAGFVYGLYCRRRAGLEDGFSEDAFRAAIGHGALSGRERTSQALMTRGFEALRTRGRSGYLWLGAGLLLSPFSLRLTWRKILVSMRLRFRASRARTPSP